MEFIRKTRMIPNENKAEWIRCRPHKVFKIVEIVMSAVLKYYFLFFINTKVECKECNSLLRIKFPLYFLFLLSYAILHSQKELK